MKCLLDLLPIDILTHEIAPADHTVYHVLVVGYPRFARALSANSRAQIVSSFMGRFNNRNYRIELNYTMCGGLLHSIGDQPALVVSNYISYYTEYGILTQKVAGDICQKITSCADCDCLNNKLWGAHAIRRYQRDINSQFLQDWFSFHMSGAPYHHLLDKLSEHMYHVDGECKPKYPALKYQPYITGQMPPIQMLAEKLYQPDDEKCVKDLWYGRLRAHLHENRELLSDLYGRAAAGEYVDYETYSDPGMENDRIISGEF